MDFQLDRSRTVCFSGHRPEKLPCGGDDSAVVIKALKSMLSKMVIDSINDGYDCFITGCAKGIDLWAGNIVLSERTRFKDRDIRLIAAMPYKGHGSGFKGYDKWLLGNILNKAHKVYYTSEKYSPGCMRIRNEFMINNSSRLIAALSDPSSGTGQTLRLAEKQGLDTKVINISQLALLAESAAEDSCNIIIQRNTD